ncbi:decarboxylase [Lacrimispora sp. JR3]|uniref:decarboxylase n=1 Tax=Lacrimispora sinapis TaxID=3111456 RepID=UPI003749502D
MKEAFHAAAIEFAARNYQTPFYVFDTDLLAGQIKKIRTVLGDGPELCYAMKANPFLVKSLEGLVDSFEVCSPGEFAICERAELPMNKIVMSGVHKNPSDVEYALKEYGGDILYTIESLSHWQTLKAFTETYRLPVRALLRLTSGNQFGMEECLIRKIIGNGPYEFITIEGIQYFSGTQKKSPTRLSKELAMLDGLCRELKDQYDFNVSKIEYGPGLPVCYFEEEANQEDLMLASLSASIKTLTFGGKVTLEMGRFIAASCGSYVTRVVDQKTNKGQNYCIVDGGIHQLNYYGQMLAMKKPSIVHLGKKGKEVKEWTVCGSLCTVNDVLVKQYPFQDLKKGDTLVFQKTGAYSVTEGMSLFLSRDFPLILLYSEKHQFQTARPSLAADQFNYTQS